MLKVVVHRAGHYDRLRVESHPSVSLLPGQVRIAVTACGVNYADCIVRMGLYASAKEYVGWPITPGFEVAGTVVEVAPGVDRWAVGDDVLAVTRFGGYTEELAVDATQVFVRPTGLSAVQAAAVPSVFLTAWYALEELARPEPGGDVLVHSAAGGVGQALVQLALARGCRVVGVVGASHKVATVRALGSADALVVVDKSADAHWWRRVETSAPRGFAAVFDANGVATLRDSYRHLAPRGTLVVYGFATMLPRGGRRVRWSRLAWDFLRTPRFSPLHLTQHNHNIMGFNLSYLFEKRTLLARGMNSVLERFATGGLRPPPTEIYALSDVARAHRAIESGRTVGKLVLATRHAAGSRGHE